MSKLSHIDDKGQARMVDVSEKAITARRAVAEGFIVDAAGNTGFGRKRPIQKR